jgi:hypothetical protein
MNIDDYLRGEYDAETGDFQEGQSKSYEKGFSARYEFIERMSALTDEIGDYENA